MLKQPHQCGSWAGPTTLLCLPFTEFSWVGVKLRLLQERKDSFPAPLSAMLRWSLLIVLQKTRSLPEGHCVGVLLKQVIAQSNRLQGSNEWRSSNPLQSLFSVGFPTQKGTDPVWSVHSCTVLTVLSLRKHFFPIWKLSYQSCLRIWSTVVCNPFTTS